LDIEILRLFHKTGRKRLFQQSLPSKALKMFVLKLFISLSVIFVGQIQCQAVKRRMEGALESDIKDVPWVVAFYKKDFSVVGTGVILSNKWILTGAKMWAEK
jgi:hypothetical protein